MIKYCKKCKKEFDCKVKKCSDCGGKLEKQYTEQELEEIKKQNDIITTINALNS